MTKNNTCDIIFLLNKYIFIQIKESQMNSLKYNHVIFGYDTDLYRIPFGDINKLDNAVYLYKPIDSDSRVLTLLYKAHTTKKINSLIKLPFKSIWNPMMFRHKFGNGLPICFTFLIRRCDLVEQGLIGYLKKQYPGSKFVCFYTDVMKTCLKYDLDRIRREFDLLLTFDQADAEKYGLVYHPLVYSQTDIPDNDAIDPCDVFFVGHAKNRLDDILTAYEKLRGAGLKCDFHISGVAERDRRFADEIDYCDKMPYTENLQRIKKSRCMLEIMQKGGHGFTLRACEAIEFDRKLLTNNPEVANAPFYSPDAVSVFTDPNSIDTDFVKSGGQNTDYGYKEQLSPVHLLEFIESRI